MKETLKKIELIINEIKGAKDIVGAKEAVADVLKELEVKNSLIPIKYIGKRAEYRDGAFGTMTKWKQGETIAIPNAIAMKMLKHDDVYVAGKADDCKYPDVDPGIKAKE